MTNKKTVNIFWTGGWDSTYRVVELSFQDIIIQPVYCLFSQRRSTSLELQRMNEIVKILQNKPATKAQFLPIKIINVDTLPKDESFLNARAELNKKNTAGSIGSQYVFLAQVAQQFPGIELGLEKPNGEFGGGTSTINSFGKLIQHNGTFALDKAHTTGACYKIFGNMTFPIFHKTEVQTLQNIRDWGYEDVMKHIWFCHTPLKEKGQWQPCGICRPCQQKMECNMEFLLPAKAQKRYPRWKFLSKYIGKDRARLFLRLFHFYKVKDFTVKEK